MTNSIRTQQFLRYISRRLSGREDCKKVQFRVGVGVPLPECSKNLPKYTPTGQYIFFSPEVQVYKDLYHRKDADLSNIVDHILHRYYEDLLVVGQDKFGNLLVDTSKLVPGVYEYQLSVDGKRRRWVRRNEFVINSKKPVQFRKVGRDKVES